METREVVVEPQKNIPVYCEVDVVVAGAGISGSFAAITAGRYGAKTLLVDRFGSLGGNIGPAMICGGSLYAEASCSLPGGLAGIPLEFKKRVEILEPRCDCFQSFTASFVLEEMVREAGVELLLSSYVSNPIMDGSTVCGVLVESCSGRVAVKAQVVVDATGEASIAARAGAPIIRHMAVDPAADEKMLHGSYGNSEYRFWNDTHLRFFVDGVDCEKYEAFEHTQVTLSEDDAEWAKKYWGENFPTGLAPAAHRAFAKTGFRIHGDIIEPKKASSYVGGFGHGGAGIITFWVAARGEINCDDARQMSRIETFLRRQAYRMWHFLKQNAPGFENSFLIAMTNYVGMRGGPCIDGEYMLTVKDYKEGTRFNDVIYRNIHAGYYHGGESSGFDVPFRCLLPKRVDGLLVAGRGTSFYRRGHDPSAMRARASMMILGQVAGTAAAMAAKEDIFPRNLNVKRLQEELLKAGLNLGQSV